MTTYQGERVEVVFHTDFLTGQESAALFQHLEANVPWAAVITPGRRVNQNYGEKGVSYKLVFGPRVIERKVLPWGPESGSPGTVLWAIKERLTALTGAPYNYVVVQRYPSGKVGIKAHRDKEMRKGTDISGISLGATRTLTLSPPRYNQRDTTPLQISLTPGSLYILKPPTNDHWTHSIEKEPQVTGVRISLTYRYAEPPLPILPSLEMSELLSLVPIEEILTYHPEVTRAGVIPYSEVGSEVYWLMGVSPTGRLSDFGGGCRPSKGEIAVNCLLRETHEESSGLVTEPVRQSIGAGRGLIVWKARSRAGPPYRYLLFAPIVYYDYSTLFRPNSEVVRLIWVRQSEAINPQTDIQIFHSPLHQYIRRLRRL